MEERKEINEQQPEERVEFKNDVVVPEVLAIGNKWIELINANKRFLPYPDISFYQTLHKDEEGSYEIFHFEKGDSIEFATYEDEDDQLNIHSYSIRLYHDDDIVDSCSFKRFYKLAFGYNVPPSFWEMTDWPMRGL